MKPKITVPVDSLKYDQFNDLMNQLRGILSLIHALADIKSFLILTQVDEVPKINESTRELESEVNLLLQFIRADDIPLGATVSNLVPLCTDPLNETKH